MAAEAQDKDPWEEFDALGPAAPDRVPGYPGGEPHGFGFRTGVRSARVAVGFATYTLALGTVLALTGSIVFIAQEQWLLVGLMLLVEAIFILAFRRLLATGPQPVIPEPPRPLKLVGPPLTLTLRQPVRSDHGRNHG